MPVPDTIACVDCGGICYRLTGDPELGWQEGDVVAYRCTDCKDLWHLELDPDDITGD